MQYLSKDDFLIICDVLSDFFKKVKDPPPNYEHSYFEKVESILAIPQKTFDKKDLYKGVYEKAACYMYFINKLHPFENGNKRISIVATGVFLRYNNLELDVDEDHLYEFAKEVTNTAMDQDTQFQRVVTFVKSHSKPVDRLRFPDLVSWLKHIFKQADPRKLARFTQKKSS